MDHSLHSIVKGSLPVNENTICEIEVRPFHIYVGGSNLR